MHVLIEKEAQLAQDPDGPQSAIMETVNTGLERLYTQLQRECMALHPQLQLHESMHGEGSGERACSRSSRVPVRASSSALAATLARACRHRIARLNAPQRRRVRGRGGAREVARVSSNER